MKVMSEKNESLEKTVYTSIRNDILGGVLRPGDRLSITELAERYDVSRTPVTQALNALSHGGFVESIARVGYFVSSLTIKDIRDMFDLRRILESASVELACERISDEQIALLEELNTTFVHGNVESYAVYLKNHRNFHYTIALATDNRWLADAFGELLDHMQRLFIIRLNACLERSDEIVEEHAEIIDALTNRDSQAARAVVLKWTDRCERDILGAILDGRAHMKLDI
jgi:DNA-binding GntR family transcriptional regulator